MLRRSFFTARFLASVSVLCVTGVALVAQADGAGSESNDAPTVRILQQNSRSALVRSRSPDGVGLAWVPIEAIQPVADSTVILESELSSIRALMEAGDTESASVKLESILQRNPAHVEVRQLLASVYRQRWSFAPALVLIESLIGSEEEAAGLPLLKEAAELATLKAVKREADAHIRRFKRAAARARDKAEEAHADALSRQIEGGAAVVFADPDRGPKPIGERVEERQNFNRGKGNYLAAATTADAALALIRSRDSHLARSARAEIVPIDRASVDAYQGGGSEVTFRSKIRTAQVTVMVDSARWTALWDHQKHEELNGLAYLLRHSFPKCDAYAYLVTPGQPATVVASVRMQFAKSTEITLNTPARWDPVRDEALRREQQDAEDARRERGSR